MRLGDIIDERYKLKSVLGEGGMATVYLASDLIARKDVALKIIKEETMKNPINLTRFEREARAAASLNHQNIVRVINLGTAEGRPYMVTELVKGQTVRDVLNVRGKFSVLEACDIMYQLCSAVLNAHQHNVIHRDIKPHNIIINEHGALKLIDFDASRYYREDDNRQDTRLLGTPEYAPPEQYGYSQTDVRSDIYSMGMVFEELKLTEKKFLTREWEKIVSKCRNFDPKHRYQTVEELEKEVKKIMFCLD